MTDITETLAERGKVYGDFYRQSSIRQNIAGAMRRTPGWNSLKPDQEEALEMLAVKLARILNGDPNYIDNWVDIAGYATLVAERLRKESDG